MSASMVPLIGIAVLIVFAIVLLLTKKTKGGKEATQKATENISNMGNVISSTINKKTEERQPEKTDLQGKYVKNSKNSVNKEDIFNFMEFDKIQDNMIISKKGEKYTAVIKCKGINYNLMSDVEQLAVEEGFINFLNTLKFPIQLYVQAQNIDLKENIRKFRDNMSELEREYTDVNAEYNMVMNSLDSTEEEINEAEDKRESLLNVMEYGQDIVRYVEKLSVNKSMLQRSFYVLVSYYKSEITSVNSFKKEEILDICYSELFTRVQNILSGLAMSSVTGKALNSNEIAELLYSAYNRDDANYINIRQALDSGFHRLFSTSEDAIIKKNKKLKETMRKEAEYKAILALEKAFEEGNVTTPADIEDAYEEETSKMAIDIIKRERISQDMKDKAKAEVISAYKEGKKQRLQEREEQKEEMLKHIEEEKREHDGTTDEISNQEEVQEEETIVNNVVEENPAQIEESIEDAEDSIV